MRTWFLLLVIVLAAHPAVADPKVPSKKASLKAIELKEARPFNYLLPEGRTPAEKQQALQCKIANRKLTLVDVDGDGRFDEEGVDGWSLGNYSYLLPYEQPFIFGTALVRITIQEDKKSLLWSAAAMRGSRLYMRELSIINGIRMRNGIPPAAYSIELSKGCRLHCIYMAKHGMTHYEDPSKPEYTEAGDQAGRSSNIAMAWMQAGVGAFRQFYHRRTMAKPGTREMGFGMGPRVVCVDGLSSQTSRPWKWPIIIPAPGTGYHTISYDHTETPEPVPGGPPAGMPITLRWLPGTVIKSVKAKVFEAKKDRQLRAKVSSPEKPAHPDVPDNNDSICIIPSEVLKPGKTYRVEVKAEVEGEPYERTFEFTTHKRAKL